MSTAVQASSTRLGTHGPGLAESIPSSRIAWRQSFRSTPRMDAVDDEGDAAFRADSLTGDRSTPRPCFQGDGSGRQSPDILSERALGPGDKPSHSHRASPKVTRLRIVAGER